MKKFAVIVLFMMFVASPNLYASCAILGIWELDSETEQLSLEFFPAGKATISQGAIGKKMSKSEASWKCEGQVLSIFGADKSLIKQLSDIRMMSGFITVTNKTGELESYVYMQSEQEE